MRRDPVGVPSSAAGMARCTRSLATFVLAALLAILSLPAGAADEPGTAGSAPAQDTPSVAVGRPSSVLGTSTVWLAPWVTAHSTGTCAVPIPALSLELVGANYGLEYGVRGLTGRLAADGLGSSRARWSIALTGGFSYYLFPERGRRTHISPYAGAQLGLVQTSRDGHSRIGLGLGAGAGLRVRVGETALRFGWLALPQTGAGKLPIPNGFEVAIGLSQPLLHERQAAGNGEPGASSPRP